MTTSGRKAVEWLERQRRYQRLGNGVYSDVFATCKKGRAIKVARFDDQWPDFVFWAIDRGFSGGLAPRVYSFSKLDRGYLAVVERLKETVEDTDDTAARVAYRELRSALNGVSEYSEFSDETKRRLGAEAERFIAEFRERWGSGGGDFHGGNFMLREDGSLVVNDPFAGSASPHAPHRARSAQIERARRSAERWRSDSQLSLGL